MKSKFIKSLLFTFIATLSIYSLSKSDIYNRININLSRYFRQLSSQKINDYTDQFCGNASDDLNTLYSKTTPNYNYSVPEGNEIAIEFINNNFTLEGTESIQDLLIKYSKANSGYIFIFILFCLLVILWIPCVLCVCCRCCCCIPDSCGKNQRLLSFVSIGLIAIVAICCFKGYTKNTGIFEGIYGIGCSILKIEDHLARGDDYKVKPYWIGVSGIIDIFDSAINDIKGMGEEPQKLITKLNDIPTEDFKTELDGYYNSKKTKTISNPNPGEKPIIPEYIIGYGPVDKENSVLYIYNEIVKTSIKSINDVLEIINFSDEKLDSLTSGINSVTSFLNKTVSEVESTMEDYLNKYGDYLDQADSYFRISMNTLFSLNLVLAIAVILSLVFIFCCLKGKCLLGLAWFFLFFFMLFSLLFGVIFGIFSNLFRDAAFGTDYFIKNINNLNVEQLSGEIKGTIDICLNGDGAIENSELVDIKSMEDPGLLDEIHKLQNNVTEGINTLKAYQSLTVNEIINKILEVKQKPSNTSISLRKALDEIQKYIDSSVSGSYVTKENINDIWVDNEIFCPEGYNYLPPDLKLLRNLVEETKNCLVISEWDENGIKNRYDNGFLTDEGENIYDYVSLYYKSIMKFLEENNNLIDEIISDLKKSNQTFINIVDDEIKIVNGILDIAKPVINLFNGILGEENSIFSLINCGFLKRDVNFFLMQMYDELGGSLKTTSTTFIFIGLLEFFLTLMVLILMKSGKDNRVTSRDVEKV